MSVRLNITMEEGLYKRLKKELPPGRISLFIEAAVRGADAWHPTGPRFAEPRFLGAVGALARRRIAGALPA